MDIKAMKRAFDATAILEIDLAKLVLNDKNEKSMSDETVKILFETIFLNCTATNIRLLLTDRRYKNWHLSLVKKLVHSGIRVDDSQCPVDFDDPLMMGRSRRQGQPIS